MYLSYLWLIISFLMNNIGKLTSYFIFFSLILLADCRSHVRFPSWGFWNIVGTASSFRRGLTFSLNPMLSAKDTLITNSLSSKCFAQSLWCVGTNFFVAVAPLFNFSIHRFRSFSSFGNWKKAYFVRVRSRITPKSSTQYHFYIKFID